MRRRSSASGKVAKGRRRRAETPKRGKPGDTKVRLATTYVVEKDKPLVSPA